MIDFGFQIAIWGYAILGETLEPDALRAENERGAHPEPWDHDRAWLNTWRDQDGNPAPEWWALSYPITERRRRFLTRKLEAAS